MCATGADEVDAGSVLRGCLSELGGRGGGKGGFAQGQLDNAAITGAIADDPDTGLQAMAAALHQCGVLVA